MILPQIAGVLGIEEGETGEAGIAWYAHAGGFAAGALSMLVFGRDAMRRLQLNREGKWEIQEAVAEAVGHSEIAGGEQKSVEKPVEGSACQYCRTPLDDSHKIDNTLFRCPNPECRRLTYVTDQPLAAAGSRRW